MSEPIRLRFQRAAVNAVAQKQTAQSLLVEATNSYMAEHNIAPAEFAVAFRRIVEILPSNASAYQDGGPNAPAVIEKEGVGC